MLATTVNADVVTNFGLELGIYCLASMVIAFMVLKRIHGDFSNLDLFFATKKWKFLEDDRKLVRFTKFLKIITYILLTTPFVCLYLWGGIVIDLERSSNSSVIPGASILLIGTSMISGSLAILFIKWSHFKIKAMSMIFFLVSFGSYFAF